MSLKKKSHPKSQGETDQETIYLSKKLKSLLDEYHELLKSEGFKIERRKEVYDKIDPETGRYIGSSNRIKSLELQIDKATRDLVNKYRNLAHYCVKKFRIPPVVEHQDVVGVAEAALYKGFKRYNPEVSKATTFITRTVIGEIKRYFRDYGWTWKVPRKLKEAATSPVDNDKDLDRVLSQYNISKDEMEKIRDILRTPVSHEDYHETVASDETSFDSHSPDIDSHLNSIFFDEDPSIDVSEILDEIERKVLYMRYVDERPVADIADLLFIEQPKVRNIIDSSINKLKEFNNGV